MNWANNPEDYEFCAVVSGYYLFMCGDGGDFIFVVK